jgi:Asp-tRNA(Asn)/Glu-tRNA(Gln) amidotransferase A subunit family amidase
VLLRRPHRLAQPPARIVDIPFQGIGLQVRSSAAQAMSLPLGVSGDGLPIGVQLAAQALREHILLRVASQLEEAMPWADRRPAVCAG